MRNLTTIIFLMLVSFNIKAQQVSLVKDIRTGVSSSNPEYFYKAADNKIYFFAINPASSFRALYVTDGTEAGTKLLLDDVTTTFSYDNMYNENNFLTYNGNFCFWARVGNAQYYQLWFTNGTAQGTYALTNFTVGATIYSLLELNNQIYFFATFTSPDAIYRSNAQAGDATPIVTLASDQRLSRLVKNAGKIYRISRFEIFEILSNNTESKVYSDLNYCIGERAVLNNKLVFNKRACSTVDPIYQSTESYDFTSQVSTTISTNQVLGTNNNTVGNRLKVFASNLYSATIPIKPTTGLGSKTDILYLRSSNGSSIQNRGVFYIDSCTIQFNGYSEFNGKLYMALAFTPSTPNPTHIITRIYELNANNVTKIFEFQDVTSNYKFKKNNYAVLNDRVLFIADTNGFSLERSNLLLSNGNSFSPVFASNDNSVKFELSQLIALNSQTALLSARLNFASNDVGLELFKFNLTATGINQNNINEIKIYPNPANNQINILINSKINKVEIYDLNGRLVLVDEGAEINIQELDKGMYILKAQTELGVYSAKFIRD